MGKVVYIVLNTQYTGEEMLDVPSSSQEQVLQDRFNQEVAVAISDAHEKVVYLEQVIGRLEARILALEAKV